MSPKKSINWASFRSQTVIEFIRRYRNWLGAGVILVAFAILILAIDPRHEFAIEDDWDYSKAVWHLLHNGIFRRGELMEATALFPVVWGTLFSRVFGFSFTVLRLSTLVLAGGTLFFFYALLGELEFDGPRRIIATLTLLVAPVFVFLAFSFMTDVSCLFGIVGALFYFVRAQRQRKIWFAFIGSIFATLAFLARQLGGSVSLAFGLVILFSRWEPTSSGKARWARLRWLFAATFVPVAVICIYFGWVRFWGGATWADKTRSVSSTLHLWLQPASMGVLLRRFVETMLTIGIYLLPLWFALTVALPAGWRAWRQSASWQKMISGLLLVGFVTVLLRLAARDEWFPYLPDQLTRRGLRPYLAYASYELNLQRPLVFPVVLSVLLTGLAAMTGLILCLWMVKRFTAPVSPELALVYGTTLILAVGSLIFFSYYERYLLPLLPGVIILVLDVTRRERFSFKLGLLGFLIVAICSIMVMQDYFGFSETKWQAARTLCAKGVPIEKIDAGFEWDGWYLYDESLAFIHTHDLPMQITPWEYIWDPEYIFAFAPVPGYQLEQELTFPTPLRAGGNDHILLLRRVN